jgi:phosphatidylserine decarboxylase
MGWFEHGSTIIMFAPRGAVLNEGVRERGRIRMGESLMRIDRTDDSCQPGMKER